MVSLSNIAADKETRVLTG